MFVVRLLVINADKEAQIQGAQRSNRRNSPTLVSVLRLTALKNEHQEDLGENRIE